MNFFDVFEREEHVSAGDCDGGVAVWFAFGMSNEPWSKSFVDEVGFYAVKHAVACSVVKVRMVFSFNGDWGAWFNVLQFLSGEAHADVVSENKTGFRILSCVPVDCFRVLELAGF